MTPGNGPISRAYRPRRVGCRVAGQRLDAGVVCRTVVQRGLQRHQLPSDVHVEQRGATVKIKTGAASPLSVSGLTNLKLYACTVVAINRVERAPERRARPSKPVCRPRRALSSPRVGTRRVAVSFATPATTGGSPITGYEVSCTSTNGGTSGSNSRITSPITVSGLTNLKTYVCTVTASNGSGAAPGLGRLGVRVRCLLALAKVQLMSCNEGTVVERTVELDASPDEVWDELPETLADPERVRVDDQVDPGRRLTFWWMPAAGDDPPSYVEIDLEPSAIGTILHVRETMIDGAHLVRTAFNAHRVRLRPFSTRSPIRRGAASSSGSVACPRPPGSSRSSSR